MGYVYVEKGMRLIKEGDQADCVFIIGIHPLLSSHITQATGTLQKLVKIGHQVIDIQNLGPGSLLGDHEILYDCPRRHSYIAKEPTEL